MPPYISLYLPISPYTSLYLVLLKYKVVDAAAVGRDRARVLLVRS